MATILFIMAFFTRNLVFSVSVLVVASIFFRFGVGATYSLAVKIAEPYSASISGYLTFVANVGGVISTALIGSLADSLGFQYIFVVFAFLFGRSTILSFYLESHLNEQNDRGG